MILKDGKIVNEEIAEEAIAVPDIAPDKPPEYSKIHQLAAGLSTAKTIAEIRSAAQQILDETDGGEGE